MWRILMAVGVVVAVVGCVGDSPGDVTREGFEADGLTWPLTDGEGHLDCRSPGAVTITVDGVVYAVNGVALGDDRWVDIAAIQLVDEVAARALEEATGRQPDPPPRVAVDDLIDEGLTLC